MGFPSIEAPIRVLIRTRLAQLEKIDHSFDKADAELIRKLCDSLSIIDETKIIHLITRISDDKKVVNKKMVDKKVDDKQVDDKQVDDKKLGRVDIIFDYGLPTIKCQPRVMAYSITVEGSDLNIKPLLNPNIRQSVNRTVDTYNEINLENSRCFPIRPDTRAETRRKRLAMLPVVGPSF